MAEVVWPFETVDQARFDRLTEREKGRVEFVLLQFFHELEVDLGPMVSEQQRKRLRLVPGSGGGFKACARLAPRPRASLLLVRSAPGA